MSDQVLKLEPSSDSVLATAWTGIWRHIKWVGFVVEIIDQAVLVEVVALTWQTLKLSCDLVCR